MWGVAKSDEEKAIDFSFIADINLYVAYDERQGEDINTIYEIEKTKERGQETVIN